ncbi:hypothetical protein GCM10027566_27520 [Arachidicoccus ginsenosidivorans]
MSTSSSNIKNIVESLADLLAQRNKRIAFAESATAGYLMSAFACCVHYEVLSGGIVCYDASIKTNLLGVDPKMIDANSAESTPVTEAITQGLRVLIPADYYIGITGLLKPGGSESPAKPVGTIYTCIIENTDKLSVKNLFEGTAEQIRDQCLEKTCMLLIEKLSMSTI